MRGSDRILLRRLSSKGVVQLMEIKLCGECNWNQAVREWYGGRWHWRFFCDNEDSDNYGSPTAYDDGCDDWEERK